MILLNPRHMVRNYPDQRSQEIMEKTIAFFESKGLTRLKEDYNGAVWYADFIEFCKQEGILASLMTPAGQGKEGENHRPPARWRPTDRRASDARRSGDRTRG